MIESLNKLDKIFRLNLANLTQDIPQQLKMYDIDEDGAHYLNYYLTFTTMCDQALMFQVKANMAQLHYTVENCAKPLNCFTQFEYTPSMHITEMCYFIGIYETQMEVQNG